MKKLVFVCRANMVRSPIAEAVFNQDPVEGWKAYSYGTAVVQEGRQGIKLAEWKGLEAAFYEMKKRGMDITDKQCAQLLPEHLADADKVIVMSEVDFVPEWLERRHDERWEIPNPEIISAENAVEIIELLTEKIAKLKKSL